MIDLGVSDLSFSALSSATAAFLDWVAAFSPATRRCAPAAVLEIVFRASLNAAHDAVDLVERRDNDHRNVAKSGYPL